VIDAAVRCALPLALRKEAALRQEYYARLRRQSASTAARLEHSRSVGELLGTAIALRVVAPVSSPATAMAASSAVAEAARVTSMWSNSSPSSWTAGALTYALQLATTNRLDSARQSAVTAIQYAMLAFPSRQPVNPALVGFFGHWVTPNEVYQVAGVVPRYVTPAMGAAVHEAVIRALCDEVDAEPRLLLSESEPLANELTRQTVLSALAWWAAGRAR
jgi:hypothetical protein